MSKKIIKYTSRIVLGLFTLFWGFVTWAFLTPMEGYYHCEAGQEEMSPNLWRYYHYRLFDCILFCLV